MNLNISQTRYNRMVYLGYNDRVARVAPEPTDPSRSCHISLDGRLMESDMLLLEDRRHYTYAHARATTGEIFYIGKGSGRRANDITRSRSAWYKSVVANHGVEVRILRQHMTASEAYAHEIKLIADAIDSGVNLVNMKDGGLGGSGFRHTEESRKKISSAQRSVKRTDSWKKNISKSLSGKVREGKTLENIISANKRRAGVKLSAERCAQMSALLKGIKRRPLSDETKAKISAARKGQSLSLETRKKISISSTGRISGPRPADVRAKISAKLAGKVSPNKGKPMSDEQKKKISLACIGRVSSRKGVTLSAETKKKLSDINTGKKRGPHSEDARAKISAARKAYWARRHAEAEAIV